MKQHLPNKQTLGQHSKTKALRAFLLTTGTAVFSTLFSTYSVAEEPHAYFCGPENPVEARSIEAIIPALYQIVSGKAGSDKNWPLMKTLFADTASVTPVFHTKEGKMTANISSVDEFIALNKTIFKDQNFFETEVGNKTFTFGHMANVLSHYESRDAIGAEPYAQGVNSFQLLNDGRRWCVISVTWDSHSKDHPLKDNILE